MAVSGRAMRCRTEPMNAGGKEDWGRRKSERGGRGRERLVLRGGVVVEVVVCPEMQVQSVPGRPE